MKLKLFNSVLFRIPQFPVDTRLQDCWPELKRSIKESSGYFYKIIKDLDYPDIENQPQSIRFTIAKYFNRSKFRATPYGTFAGIGIGNIDNKDQSQLTISSDRKEFRFRDWKQAEQYTFLWKEQALEKLYLQTNSSYYRIGDSIRYIYKNEDRFELSDMPYYPEIDQILKACIQTLSYTTLSESAQTHGLDVVELKEIVSELIESQLLLTNFHPNIIGNEYFERIGKSDFDEEQQTYTICNHELLSGSIQARDYKVIAEAISVLHQRRDFITQNHALASFIDKFRKRYDMQAVPIMEALDPVIGIGYGDLERTTELDGIADKILKAKTPVGVTSSAERFKKSILSRMVSETPGTIHLEEIPDVASSDPANPLPNTLSAIVTKAGELLIVDSLGGTTATSLLGRFNLIDGEVEDICRNIAKMENESNPDVAFFDLAYMGEPGVDNINRRKAVYNHQLCIVNWDDSETRINLNDILLFVRGSTLILYSEALKKRLIPRMSTAYNYTRSDLSLFRLLCDIQTQGITGTLLPDWKNSLPDCLYYPRIQYKNVVLSRATWKLNYNRTFVEPSAFNTYLQALDISKLIKVGQADQTLTLSLNCEYDRALLLSILKSSKDLWIEEAFHESNRIVKDINGKSYCSELILSFYHKEEIYKGISPDPYPVDTIRRFAPGTDWIYYKLYCSNSITNGILTDHIAPLLTELHKLLQCWFFIRYDEGGDHLRLRLQPRASRQAHFISDRLNSILHPLFENGLIHDIQLATYQRELERYSTAGIDKVEYHFSVDSNYCLTLLSSHITDTQLYHLISRLMATVGNALFEPVNFQNLINATRLSFQKEHQTEHAIYRDINKAYNQEQLVHDRTPPYLAIKSQQLQHSFKSVLSGSNADKQSMLFVDLFHMHINRIFSRDQRVHEYIIYEYLSKHLKVYKKAPTF